MVSLYVPADLTPVYAEQELGRLLNRSGLFGAEKNPFPLLGFKTWKVQPVAQSQYRRLCLAKHVTRWWKVQQTELDSLTRSSFCPVSFTKTN